VTKPTKTYNPSDLPPAIAQKIGIDALDHWVWTGNYHPDGLPLIGSKMAHSTIYRYLNPEIADRDGRILRTCGAKTCVNPAHMRFPQEENGGLEARNTRAKDGRSTIKAVGVQKVQSVETDTQNSSDLVKVLQRIAEALEEGNRKR
jgi:hypothetical protein